MSAKNKLRLLALHGHRQSGDSFAKKTGALKKILTGLGVGFIYYPTAPHKLDEPNDDGEVVYSWFNWHPIEKWSNPDSYTGVEESIQLINDVFKSQGPFDGVLGFSQGGVLLSVLSGMRVPKEKSYHMNQSGSPISFDFAIFAATFAPPVLDYYRYLSMSNTCAPLHTLHIYGTQDTLVDYQISKKLAAVFEDQASSNPTSDDDEKDDQSMRIYKTAVHHLEHVGGHFMATNAASKLQYKQFFESMSSS